MKKKGPLADLPMLGIKHMTHTPGQKKELAEAAAPGRLARLKQEENGENEL